MDPQTREFYETVAPRYTLSGSQRQSRHLDEFLDRLEPGARILELGCGGGRDSAHMAVRGFAIDPTDGIAPMVQKARERFVLPARQMLFADLDAVAAYDAIWAHACLIHVPRAELPDVLGAIRRALRPGGLHFASFKLGAGEGRDMHGRLHNFPAADWTEDVYRQAGFDIVHRLVFRGSGADGTVRDWIALTVRTE